MEALVKSWRFDVDDVVLDIDVGPTNIPEVRRMVFFFAWLVTDVCAFVVRICLLAWSAGGEVCSAQMSQRCVFDVLGTTQPAPTRAQVIYSDTFSSTSQQPQTTTTSKNTK